MGPCHYHLIDRPGHTGRLSAFGNYSKNCTNKNLTDELAEWHLRVNPACAKLFDRMPATSPVTPFGVKIIQPVKVEESAKTEELPKTEEPSIKQKAKRSVKTKK
jgi:hypothetical protein